MTTKRVSIPASQFILGDDGVYVGTVLATTHGLGTDVCIVKCVQRDDDLTMENVLLSYKVEVNGDIKVFVDEPVLIRMLLATDVIV